MRTGGPYRVKPSERFSLALSLPAVGLMALIVLPVVLLPLAALAARESASASSRGPSSAVTSSNSEPASRDGATSGDDAKGSDSDESQPNLATPYHSPLAPMAYGVWMGISYDSPSGVFLGMTPGRDFHEFAFRLGWRLIDHEFFRAEYTVDLIPFAMVTGNPISQTSTRRTGISFIRETRVVAYETHYGVGAAPIGLKLGVPFERTFLFVSGSAGFLVFNAEVPIPEASLFNYTFDFGGGVELALTPHWGLIGGYKFSHMSNAGLAFLNPGLDSNVWYFGTTFMR